LYEKSGLSLIFSFGNKTKEEGRRKKEEGWNCDGELNPYI